MFNIISSATGRAYAKFGPPGRYGRVEGEKTLADLLARDGAGSWSLIPETPTTGQWPEGDHGSDGFDPWDGED